MGSVIREIKPQVVMLELDIQRVGAFLDKVEEVGDVSVNLSFVICLLALCSPEVCFGDEKHSLLSIDVIYTSVSCI